MKVELKRNVLHGVRVVQAGKIIDVTDALAKELIDGGLATAAAQPKQDSKTVSSDEKKDETKADKPAAK
jgi:hypothetical protein